MDEELMEVIIRGLFPNNKDRYYEAVEKIDRTVFTGTHRDLWDIICNVYDLTSELLDNHALARILEHGDMDQVKRVEIEELWDDIAELNHITDVDFKATVSLLVDQVKKQKFGELLEESAKMIEVGIDQKGTRVRGIDNALEHARKGLEDINAVAWADSFPIVNLRQSGSNFLDEVEAGGTIKRFATGCTPIDEMTHGGPGTGELWMVVAYTGIGKSLWCINFAHEFVMGGANVLYLTLETQLSQIQKRFRILHAKQPQFGVGGVSLDSLNKHSSDHPTLTDTEYERLHESVQEFDNNPDYGNLIVAQFPTNAKISQVKALLNRQQQQHNIDIVIIDSIDMLTTDTRRNNRREELNEIILATKEIAKDFDNGRGVPVITPWQTSREAYHKSGEDGTLGRYDITALAETSEAERRADCILAIGEKPDTPHRLRCQTLKWRDGQPRDFEIKVDYDHCLMGSKESINVNIEFDLIGM